MTGQPCGICGVLRTAEGCACRFGSDAEETAIIPVIGGPELVRPYVHPTEVLGAAPIAYEPALGHPSVYEAPAGYATPAVYGAPADYDALPAQWAEGTLLEGPAPAGPHSTELLPYVPAQVPAAVRSGRRGIAPRGIAPHGGGRGEREGGRGRRMALIGAGALTVAGLGIAAALVPRMFSGSTDQSLPRPGVTLALPTAAPDSPSAAPSAAATGGSAPASAAPSPHPTRPARASTKAAAVPPPHSVRPTTAAPTGSPATATSTPSSGPQSLQLGDHGAAVATLQRELSNLWIDPRDSVDGNFDDRTRRDVVMFQRWFGVTGDPSGVFGPNSQAAMNRLPNH